MYMRHCLWGSLQNSHLPLKAVSESPGLACSGWASGSSARPVSCAETWIPSINTRGEQHGEETVTQLLEPNCWKQPVLLRQQSNTAETSSSWQENQSAAPTGHFNVCSITLCLEGNRENEWTHFVCWWDTFWLRLLLSVPTEELWAFYLFRKDTRGRLILWEDIRLGTCWWWF